MHMALSDYVQHIERKKILRLTSPLTKGLRHLLQYPPTIYFYKVALGGDVQIHVCSVSEVLSI
jgi:hypothetical protein